MKFTFLSIFSLVIILATCAWAMKPAETQTMVLIHAFPTDQRLWQPQETLKRHFKLITLDLKGFGQGEPTDGSAVTMTEYADQVKRLLDQLHISKAIIGGESMGGYVALAFFEKYPAAVSGLILSDTQSIADTQEMKEKRESTARDVLEHGTATASNSFMTKALSANASESTKAYLRNIVDSQTPTAFASAQRGMAQRADTSHLLVETNLPVLIITGEQDILISPQQGESMHKLAKNSKLIMIPNAGHLSSLEQPDAWNQAVMNMYAGAN